MKLVLVLSVLPAFISAEYGKIPWRQTVCVPQSIPEGRICGMVEPDRIQPLSPENRDYYECLPDYKCGRTDTGACSYLMDDEMRDCLVKYNATEKTKPYTFDLKNKNDSWWGQPYCRPCGSSCVLDSGNGIAKWTQICKPQPYRNCLVDSACQFSPDGKCRWRLDDGIAACLSADEFKPCGGINAIDYFDVRTSTSSASASTISASSISPSTSVRPSSVVTATGTPTVTPTMTPTPTGTGSALSSIRRSTSGTLTVILPTGNVSGSTKLYGFSFLAIFLAALLV